jgi:hypothetical protein
METLSGFIASFDKAMVVHKDLYYFGPVRDELIQLTAEYNQLNLLDLLIQGYDDDNRSLYEVPEVTRWIRMIYARWPDLLYWLTPTSLRVYMLCLNPSMHQRLPDGRIQIALDLEELSRQFVASAVADEKALSKAGMARDKIDPVSNQADRNLLKMFERISQGKDYDFGKDYILIHPKDGKVRKYQMKDQV